MTAARIRGMAPDDLYRITSAEDAQVSPDGAQVAFVRRQMDRETDAYRSTIWRLNSSGGEPVPFTTSPREDTHPRWSPDGAWLAFLSNRDGDKKQIWLIPTQGGEARRLTDQSEGVQSFVWCPDGSRLAFVARAGQAANGNENHAGGGSRTPTRFITTLKYKANGEGFVSDRQLHVFVVDRDAGDGGAAHQITDGDHDDVQPCWSPDARMLAFSSARHDGHDTDTFSDIYLVPASGGSPRAITCGLGTCVAPSFAPDGGLLAYLGHLGPNPGGSRNLDLWLTSVVRGEGGDEGDGGDGDEPVDLTATLDRTAVEDLRPIWSADSKAIALGVVDHGSVNLLVVPASGGETRPLTSGRRLLTSWSFSADGRQLAFTASTPVQPSELFVRDTGDWREDAGGGERQISRTNESWRQEVQLSQPEQFSFPSVDGLLIEGWVMRPAESSAACPTLLNIHGGPHAYYGWGFFDEFQVQTGAGYAVVYVNPRGSQGYGEAFAHACCGDWGGNDYQDVMRGLDVALERFPFLDAERLGVLGGSYGGFMTSWIVGHSDRFKAAISERAVNAPASLFGTSDIGFWFEQLEVAPNPLTYGDHYWQHSPLAYAERITTPLLIVHSENDLRCPIEQAEQLYVAVKLQRKTDVIFVRFPEETHELTRSGKPSRRVERFEILLDWFDRYLRPGDSLPARSPAMQDALATLDRSRSLLS